MKDRLENFNRQFKSMLEKLYKVGDIDCEKDDTPATLLRKARGAFQDISAIKLDEPKIVPFDSQ